MTNFTVDLFLKSLIHCDEFVSKPDSKWDALSNILPGINVHMASLLLFIRIVSYFFYVSIHQGWDVIKMYVFSVKSNLTSCKRINNNIIMEIHIR